MMAAMRERATISSTAKRGRGTMLRMVEGAAMGRSALQAFPPPAAPVPLPRRYRDRGGYAAAPAVTPREPGRRA